MKFGAAPPYETCAVTPPIVTVGVATSGDSASTARAVGIAGFVGPKLAPYRMIVSPGFAARVVRAEPKSPVLPRNVPSA